MDNISSEMGKPTCNTWLKNRELISHATIYSLDYYSLKDQFKTMLKYVKKGEDGSSLMFQLFQTSKYFFIPILWFYLLRLLQNSEIKGILGTR